MERGSWVSRWVGGGCGRWMEARGISATVERPLLLGAEGCGGQVSQVELVGRGGDGKEVRKSEQSSRCQIGSQVDRKEGGAYISS